MDYAYYLEDEFYTGFLKHFFKQATGYEEFLPFFNGGFLMRHYYSVQLTQGNITDEAKSAFSVNDLELLNQQKLLNIIGSKPVFKHNEQVTISL